MRRVSRRPRYSQLYDPDRSQALSFNGEIRSWGEFTGALRDALAQQKAKNGAGIRILTETITSPTHGGADRAPSRSSIRAPSGISGSPPGRTARAPPRTQAFGQPVNTYYDFTNANVVVSLDADFLASGPASLRYARQFATRRRVRGSHDDTMNRLYVVEPMPTPTGTKADHRLPLRAGDVEEFAWALAISLGVAQGPEDTATTDDIYKWLGPIARDLQNQQGRQPRDRRRAAAADRARARRTS